MIESASAIESIDRRGQREFFRRQTSRLQIVLRFEFLLNNTIN